MRHLNQAQGSEEGEPSYRRGGGKILRAKNGRWLKKKKVSSRYKRTDVHRSSQRQGHHVPGLLSAGHGKPTWGPSPTKKSSAVDICWEMENQCSPVTCHWPCQPLWADPMLNTKNSMVYVRGGDFCLILFCFEIFVLVSFERERDYEVGGGEKWKVGRIWEELEEGKYS